MKVAVITAPWIAIPPVGYGGTEAVVYNLVEGLTKKGHDVTLYATGDSKVSCKLEFFYEKALGNSLYLKQDPYNLLRHSFHFFKNVLPKGFDIVHNNAGWFNSFFFELTDVPFVHTLHGSYDPRLETKHPSLRSVRDVLLQFKHQPFVSISNKQQAHIPQLNFVGTVYNSILLEHFKFEEKGGEEIVWLGRITKEKGIEELIKVSTSLRKRLRIAAFIDEGEKEYFNKGIVSLLTHPLVTFLPEIKDYRVKSTFLGSGKLFLFPIQWEEPFGIVMIESMATGTPVVALAYGSVPEVVRDGETGLIVNPSDKEKRGDWIIKKTGTEGLKEAVERIYSMPKEKYQKMRQTARAHVEKFFTVKKMVEGYVNVYKKIISTYD